MIISSVKRTKLLDCIDMKAPISESNLRKIASKEHNTYITDGIDRHKSTCVAPTSFLKPFSEELKQQLSIRHKLLEAKLNKILGQPYYSNNGFILYQGDSEKLLQEIAFNNIQVDLTVTSPPYNIGKEYERSMSVDEYIEWCSKWMLQVYNITKSDGTFWLNVGYLEVPEKGLCVPIPYLLWNKSPFYLLQEIIWFFRF
jgi:adenine-specific DNA-methyltransferase